MHTSGSDDDINENQQPQGYTKRSSIPQIQNTLSSSPNQSNPATPQTMHLVYTITLLATLAHLTIATDGGTPYWDVATFADRRCKQMLSVHGDQSEDSECVNVKSMYVTNSISAQVPPGYRFTVYALKNCQGDGYTTWGSWSCFEFRGMQFSEAAEGKYTGETHYSENGFLSYRMRKA